MKAWVKSKTVWFGLAVGILGAIQTTLQTAPMPEPWGGLVLAGIGAVIVALRAVTTQPIGRGE